MASRLNALRKCRLRGHHMEEFNPSDAPSPNGWYGVLSFRCETCGTRRFDFVDRDGSVGSRRYKWPDGYKVAMRDMPVKPELRLIVLRGRRRK